MSSPTQSHFFTFIQGNNASFTYSNLTLPHGSSFTVGDFDGESAPLLEVIVVEENKDLLIISHDLSQVSTLTPSFGWSFVTSGDIDGDGRVYVFHLNLGFKWSTHFVNCRDICAVSPASGTFIAPRSTYCFQLLSTSFARVIEIPEENDVQDSILIRTSGLACVLY